MASTDRHYLVRTFAFFKKCESPENVVKEPILGNNGIPLDQFVILKFHHQHRGDLMILRILVSTLTGAVVIFILAGFFFGFLFADFFASQIPPEAVGVYKEAPNFGIIAISDLVYAGMLSFIMINLSGPKTFGRGALMGMVIGFTVVLHFDLLNAATTHLTTGPAIAANVLISSFMSAVGGGVIALVLGKLDARQKGQV